MHWDSIATYCHPENTIKSPTRIPEDSQKNGALADRTQRASVRLGVQGFPGAIHVTAATTS
jgi:hypothetical protein